MLGWEGDSPAPMPAGFMGSLHLGQDWGQVCVTSRLGLGRQAPAQD